MISRSGIYGLGVCHEEVECWEFQSLFSSLSNVSSAHNLCTCPVIDRPFGSNLNYRPFTIKGTSEAQNNLSLCHQNNNHNNNF